ncbi:MAG: deoxyribose-phosphate aldolase [Pseudomonas sp.]|nr:deoxyribose-phosphate aldolase [Pseudomonas sp.]
MKAITSQEEQQARAIIGLLDLSTLHIDDDDQRIVALCKRAVSPMGEVAAVCVYPRFVQLARHTLSQLRAKRVRVCTVANFPAGASIKSAVADIRAGLVVGADEIDLMYPYQALLRGERQEATELVQACRATCGERAKLKVILETGELKDPQLIRMACEDVIAAGVNFVGTSSGKVGLTTTPQAVRILLQVIADVGGQASIKVAGGIRTFEEARDYMALAQARFGPHWVNANRVRLGASTVLDDVLTRLGVLASGR